MAIPVLANLDLNQNQILNLVLQVLASDPGAPVQGQVWYNSTTHQIKLRDNAASRVIAELSNTLDQFAAPATDVSFASHKITNLLDPTSAQDAATKGYVDAVALGLDVKASVRLATAVAGTLATSFANGQTVDGVVVATGDRILIKNQVAGAENGIYIVQATGSPVRSTDTNSSSNYVPGSFTFVEQGTANAGSAWVVQTQGVITPGTTAVTWVQFAGSGTAYSAGSGLTLTGSVFSVNVSGVTIEINAGNLRVKSSANSGAPLLSQGTGVEAAYGPLNLAGGVNIVTGNLPVGNGGTGAATAAAARANLSATGKFAASVGNASATSFLVNHALGTSDVVVEVYDNGGTHQVVNVEVQITDANNVTVVFAVAPALNAYRVVVIG